MNTNVSQKVNKPIHNSEKLSTARAAMSAVHRKSFFVEDARLVIDRVLITFIDRQLLESGKSTAADWCDGEIPAASLESFISKSFHINPGEYNDLQLAIYMEENLKDATEAYMNAGKEFKTV